MRCFGGSGLSSASAPVETVQRTLALTIVAIIIFCILLGAAMITRTARIAAAPLDHLMRPAGRPAGRRSRQPPWPRRHSLPASALIYLSDGRCRLSVGALLVDDQISLPPLRPVRYPRGTPVRVGAGGLMIHRALFIPYSQPRQLGPHARATSESISREVTSAMEEIRG